MSVAAVAGKVFTKFRPYLRFSLFSRCNRTCAVLSTGSRFRSYSTLNSLLQRRLHFKIVQIKSSQVRAMAALSPLDPSSFSRQDIAVMTHTSLSLNVDFDNKVLSGFAVLTIDILEDTKEVILDARNLTIESVELEDGTALNYTLGEEVPNFGSKLSINLGKNAAAGEFETSEESASLSSVAALSNDEVGNVKMSFAYSGFLYKPANCTKSHITLTDRLEDNTCACCECKHKKIKQMMRTTTGDPKRKSKSGLATETTEDNPEPYPDRGVKIKIKYATAPSASGLQWLEPSQTSGKQHPYLFSQCQPIHARSIMPCQDTPAVKFTYDAAVSAPAPFTVVMSALSSPGARGAFRQPVPVPAYLLALAVGVLEARQLGPRSVVWSEKEEIERSAWEFAETERYLAAAEALCGRYEWTQYDLLVLPPSFPYGGMENPCLTFVTPTLLAGDRSQADVLVHEIMHSWTGNLVTNRNFEHFWLNEGFTVFLERKVAASLISDPVEAKRSRDFHSLLGLQELNETVNDHLGTDNPLSKLVVDLKGVHPDDAFSRVPYEKGSLFLRYLEDLVGGPEVFDDFLRAYLSKFRRKSIDTNQFKAFLLEYFKDHAGLATVNWDDWLNKPGMPPIIPDYDYSMTKAVKTLLGKIQRDDATLSESDVSGFTPHQIINLLQELVDHPALPKDRLLNLGQLYKVDNSSNSEILYRWLRLCVRSRNIGKLSTVLQFLNTQGRMKYVRPIYRDLYAWEEVRQQAIDNFLKNEKYMMHVSAYTLRKDLHLSD